VKSNLVISERNVSKVRFLTNENETEEHRERNNVKGMQAQGPIVSALRLHAGDLGLMLLLPSIFKLQVKMIAVERFIL